MTTKQRNFYLITRDFAQAQLDRLQAITTYDVSNSIKKWESTINECNTKLK